VLQIKESGNVALLMPRYRPLTEVRDYPKLQTAKAFLCSVGSLHRNGVAHLDIKPANLLINDHDPASSRVLLCDLENCTSIDSPRVPANSGTEGYRGIDYGFELTAREADCFASLLTVIFILTGLHFSGGRVQTLNLRKDMSRHFRQDRAWVDCILAFAKACHGGTYLRGDYLCLRQVLDIEPHIITALRKLDLGSMSAAAQSIPRGM
jgi:hypothetical protein